MTSYDHICVHRSYKYQYMEKVKIIVSELVQDVNQLNNGEFINVCSLFFKNLLFVNDNIVKKVLGHEGNKVICKELYILSKSNGKYICVYFVLTLTVFILYYVLFILATTSIHFQ